MSESDVGELEPVVVPTQPVSVLVAFTNGRWDVRTVSVEVGNDLFERAKVLLCTEIAADLEQQQTDIAYICELSDDSERVRNPGPEPGNRVVEIPFSLVDANGDGYEQAGRIVLDGHLSLWLAGHGVQDAEPGYGEPVYLELSNNDVKLHVWPDINEPDSVEIDMSGAAEINRRKSVPRG